LTAEEQETLTRWARRRTSALASRSRIVLGCAEGLSNKEVAAREGMSQQMVCKWRARFVADQLKGMTDEPGPGAPRTISDEQIEAVLVATLERQPRDATHWSRASMADESGLSKSTVGRIWKAFGLKPDQCGPDAERCDLLGESLVKALYPPLGYVVQGEVGCVGEPAQTGHLQVVPPPWRRRWGQTARAS
jgi:transposase